ncbi:MAG: DUF4261 domain-containing protein [Actinobacteria bacterium]|nr:DUF4261 domain-containing protein [Actinomycetota bacterium]
MTSDETQTPDAPLAPATLMAELHLGERPELDTARLSTLVASKLPESVLVDTDPGSLLATFAHRAFVTDFSDRKAVPIGTLVMLGQEGSPPDHSRVDLAQTWSFSDAGERLACCKHEVLVAEMMGLPRPAVERVAAFRAVVLAVTRQLVPLAVWWPTAGVVTPAPKEDDPLLMGLVNVRMFRVEGTDGDILMDTMGLAALGLPDIQCHYNGLEPGRVATQVYNIGNYLYENGDVIEDGHTVEGLEPDQRWRCRHEASIVGPPRIVLDVNPGAPFAAGNRN